MGGGVILEADVCRRSAWRRGEVLEIEPPKRLVLRWRNEFRPELYEEGFSRATFELEPLNEVVKLTVIHEINVPKSKFIEAVSTGWPTILSSLKSLLETGEALERTRDLPKGRWGRADAAGVGERLLPRHGNADGFLRRNKVI